MKLYDSVIKKVFDLLGKSKVQSLNVGTELKNNAEKTFIFPEDAVLELGASACPSSYLVAYTSDNTLVDKDEILLVGEDISSLKGDVPFARIAIVLVGDEQLQSEQEAYRLLRNVEYKRYKVNPEGYMMRVNTNLLSEGGRVSSAAQSAGISFADVGTLLLDEYKKEPIVRAVKQIFVTAPDFDYASLKAVANLNEGVTVTLDHILKNLKMDCNTCSFKNICDEIEGMRDLHKREEYRI